MSKLFREQDEFTLAEQIAAASALPLGPRSRRGGVLKAAETPTIDVEFLGKNKVLIRCKGVILALKDGESFRAKGQGGVWILEKVEASYEED